MARKKGIEELFTLTFTKKEDGHIYLAGCITKNEKQTIMDQDIFEKIIFEFEEDFAEGKKSNLYELAEKEQSKATESKATEDFINTFVELFNKGEKDKKEKEIEKLAEIKRLQQEFDEKIEKMNRNDDQNRTQMNLDLKNDISNIRESWLAIVLFICLRVNIYL